MIKKILLSLFWIITLWLNFWICQNCNFNDIYDNDYIIQTFNYNDNSISNYNFYCAFVQFNIEWNIYYSNISFEYWWFAFNPSMLNWSFNNWLVKQLFLCDSSSERSFHIRDLQINWNVNFWVITIKELPVDFFEDYYWFDVSCPACPDCPSCSQCETDLSTCQWMYSRLETDYDLLSWNYNTCVSDLNTCMNNWWSSSSGDIQWSSLFINENQVLWNKNIFVNIPLDYEYSYTNEWEDFELTVEWLNQDYDYLDWIVWVQNTTPTKDNFNQIISWLIPLFVPWLVVILFIYFVFRLLKKIF